MLFKKTKYSLVFKTISIVLLQAFFVSNLAFATSLPSNSLAIWAANERAAAREMRAQAYRELFERELAPDLGGKCAWDEIVERLAEKIGYSTPGSIRLSIQEIWTKFIEANEAFVKEGNNFIQADIANQGSVSKETVETLRKLSKRFTFPKELEYYIRLRSEHLKGWVIDRSSGRWEDSFLRNLAGIFISPKRKDERLVVQGIKEIFNYAVNKIWITQNNPDATSIEGIPNLLTLTEGFGILVQPFIDFDASGTAMTNLYGHTSIEAVVGDADMAVRGIHANVAQYLYKKSKKPRLEYNPSFINMPYSIRLKGKEYEASKNAEEIKALMKDYPKMNGKFSPLSNKQARELYRVTNALEEEIGVPLDIEWGYLKGKLYIIQIRPIIGDFKKPLVKIDESLKKKKKIASSPIALGHTDSKGITGKMILYERGVTRETVSKIEEEYSSGYIRVQHDVASAVLERKTTAKVLVDPYQGSRQAHNINLITGRIANDEFAYCNGPILKEPFLGNLTFVPHPECANVWITDEDVTYFGDGLRGEFYTEFKEQVEDDDLQTEKTTNLKERFIKKISEILSADELQTEEKVQEILSKLGFNQFKFLLKYAFTNERPDMGQCVKQIENSYMGIETFIIQMKFLQELLEFPLFPTKWESGAIEALGKTTRIIDDYDKSDEKIKIRERKDERNEYRVFIYEYHPGEYRSIRRFFKNQEFCKVTYCANTPKATSDGWPEVEKGLEEVDYYADFVILHIGNKDNTARIGDIVLLIKRRNPNAKIVVIGAFPDGKIEQMTENGYMEFILKREYSDNVGLKITERHYVEWREKREQEIKKAPEDKAISKPEPLQKLKILFVEDDFTTRLAITTDLEKTFGLKKVSDNHFEGEEYDLFIARTELGAIDILNSEKIDYVILDWVVPKGDGKRSDNSAEEGPKDLVKVIVEKGIKDVDISTAMDLYLPKAQIYFKEIDETIIVREFPYTGYYNVVGRVQEMRQKQIELYEAALDEAREREWQVQTSKSVAKEKPTFPEKLKILWADDEADEDKKTELLNILGENEYEVYIATNYEEAKRIAEDIELDGVIFDWIMPESLETKKFFHEPFVETISNVTNIIIATYADRGHVIGEMRRRHGNELADRIKYYERAASPEYIAIMCKIWRKEQIESYEAQLTDWEKTQVEEIPEKPGYPKKLKVLMVDDDEITLRRMDEAVEHFLGKEEYEFVAAEDTDTALQILKKSSFDLVLYDGKIPNLRLIEEEILGVENAIIFTGLLESEIADYIGSALTEHSQYVAKPLACRVFSQKFIKRCRQEQIERYEKKLAEWKKTQRKPKLPEKLRVLYIDDDSLNIEVIPDYLEHELGSDNYEFFQAANLTEARRILEQNKIDAVLYDFTTEAGERTVDIGGEKHTVVFDYGPKLDDKESDGEYFDRMIKDIIPFVFVMSGIPNISEDEMWKRMTKRWGDGARDKVEFDFSPIPSENFTSIIKRFRQQQIEEWEKGQGRPKFPEKLKVLILDDDKDFREDIEALWNIEFISEEYELKCVETTEEALRLMENESFDVVVYDVKVGNFTEEIKQKLLETKYIIAISGYSSSSIEKHVGTELYKRSTYLAKPFEPDSLFSLIKDCRKKQVEEWDKENTVQLTYPEKLRVLVIDDDKVNARFLPEIAERTLGEEGDLVCAYTQEEAVKMLKEREFDVVFVDIKMKVSKNKSVLEEYNRLISEFPWIVADTGFDVYTVKEKVKERWGKDIGREDIYTKPYTEDSFVRKLKELRKRQIERYEEAQALAEKAKEATHREGKTVFVLADSGQEARDLAEFVKEKTPEHYTTVGFTDYYFNNKAKGLSNVIVYSEESKDFFWLTRLLKKDVPDIVIMDDSYGGTDVLAEAITLIRKRNPKAQFIVTSKEAAIPKKVWYSRNVLGVLEKPYHFQDVVDVLNGSYNEKVKIAKEKFKIEQARRVTTTPAHIPLDPCNINIWSGYAAPRLQKSMLTRIRKNSADSLYRVEFTGLKNLVDLACENAERDNTVTILPYAKLNQSQIKRLEETKAKVIYMDFEEDISKELGTFVQLGAIVFTGITYLNNNNNAFMSLYRLLTDEKDYSFVTIEELQQNPTLLMFVLKPATIHDYKELKRLNHLMEQVLMAA